ncbi:MAG: hypothetical protein K2G54_03275, partial [Malacoplasma sp.]|nr:hypothetical protein [Malacoplasma sp.]
FITIDFKLVPNNSDYIYEKFCYIFAGIAVLFNFLYHPINLVFRPRKVVKQYEKYYEIKNHKKINLSISSNSTLAYKIEDSLFSIKNNLSKLTYYSLFNSDIEFAKKVRNLDINENLFISDFDKERVKNKIVKPSSSGYRYLFSVGFWFLGTVNILFNLFKEKGNFIKKINIFGSVYTSFWIFFNIFLFILFFIFPITGSLKSVTFFSEESLWIFVRCVSYILFNVFYIHFVGLIFSLCAKKSIPIH